MHKSLLVVCASIVVSLCLVDNCALVPAMQQASKYHYIFNYMNIESFKDSPEEASKRLTGMHGMSF